MNRFKLFRKTIESDFYLQFSLRRENKWLERLGRGLEPGFGKKKPDPGLCTSNEGRCLKFYCISISIDNFKSIIFCFHTFGV